MLSEYSYHSWESKVGLVASKKRKKQHQMTQFVAQLMVCFGLALANQGWQQLLWIVLGILAVAQLYLDLRESK